MLEQVADSVLDHADEIVISCLVPEALMKRMQRGDIYLVEPCGAVTGLFSAGNLIALREMALQRVTRAG